jgi:lysozyme
VRELRDPGRTPIPYDGIIDISHWKNSPKLAQAKAAGFDAVIIKATQGVNIVDNTFAANWAAARANGLLRGANHFGEGANGIVQADFLLNTVNPDAGTLIALDFERNPNGEGMSISEAIEFVTHIHDKLGRWPVLYGGSELKQALNNQASAMLSQCPLWLAQYGPTAVLPPGWTRWTLWQFSDDNYNKPASAVPGVSPCDRDRFFDDRADLPAACPFGVTGAGAQV